MKQYNATLTVCGNPEPHEPHPVGEEQDVVIYGPLVRLCLGTGKAVGAAWRAHPAGGLYAIVPMVASMPVVVAYVHEDDEQELYAELAEQAEAMAAAVATHGASAAPEAPDEADEGPGGPEAPAAI